MAERTWTPFNGKSSTVSRVIEALVVAAIVGGLSVWGNAKILDVKIDNLCLSLSKVEAHMEKLDDRLTDHIIGSKP